MAPLYFEALEDLTPRLVEIAIKRCIQHHKFLPRPAEIREQVADELADDLRRKADDWNRERLMLAPASVRPPPTAEQIAAVETTMTEVRRVIAERTAPFVAERDLEERRPVRPALREITAEAKCFRLAEVDSPDVQAWLREMEGAE
jgi:hypothetical protein